METIHAVKTRAICRTPLVGCLLKASEYANISKDWVPVNPEQKEFKRHLDLSEELSALSGTEFDSIASTKEDEINKWLKDNNFTITCPPIHNGGFATASFIKLMVEWLEEAHASEVRGQNGTTYDSVDFNLGAKHFAHSSEEWHVAELPTKDSDTQVFLATTTSNLGERNDEELLTLVQNLQLKYYDTPNTAYEGVTVPMINLDSTVSQDWVVGMRSDGWSISACIQQFILKLNEKGATAKSAAVMTLTRGCLMSVKPRLIFNKPFILWFNRNGVTYPLFLAVCGYDCWNAPDDLD